MKLSKTYEPAHYEANIYALWEKAEAFVPKHRGSKKSFSIVVPPPNANGNLHIGHGLTLAIEDILVRYHRMKGEAALLLPGADHAGFETWVVYEKQLAKEGKSRFDFSREELYDQIYQFVDQNKTNYQTQFRQLGAGVDWSRYSYTLDDKVVNQAYNTFKKMFDEGLVYRAEKLVNFCTFHGTGFADIEVVHKEEEGHLWHISYPLTDGSGEVVVATTRPETMLGDTAVAVHPDDPRYKSLIGKTISLPLANRLIPILADEMVDRSFGSGAVKITPAHDFNDYEVAKRHDLPFISIIDNEGKMTNVDQQYRGLTVVEARKKIIDDLESQGLIKSVESLGHSVGHCYKCDTVIEPLLREQWFIDMQPLVGPAIKALKAKKIQFKPDSKRKQLISYLEGLRDWNISRQIAWGIPIPAFQNVDNPDDWIFDERVTQESLQIGGKTYRRDPDVFDTWFSSSSWPYVTLDYPGGRDFKQFYPLSIMETGADILFPWVSRMLMFGLYVTGQVPFKEVYLHGLVLDHEGQKMSKSKGNVVDPIGKVKQFGSDAFRMGVIAGQTAGNNQPYDESKLIGARNFCNKLWNIARFIEDKIGDEAHLRHQPQPDSLADHWILHKLQQSTDAVGELLDQSRMAEAYDAVYHLVWDDLADWYVEASKGHTNLSILAYSLEVILKLAHPFAPFLTETIWQTLAWENDSILAVSSWPQPEEYNQAQATAFADIQTMVSEARAISQSLSLSKPVLQHASQQFVEQQADLIMQLAKLGGVEVAADGPGEDGVSLVQSKYKAWLKIDSGALKAFESKLAQQQVAQQMVIKQLEGRLSNKAYVKNAPEAVVKQTQQQLAQAKDLLASLVAEQKRFSR
ncbi:MAG: valine--tRNA ligase [Candidatus Saccharimonadales bacterium]